MDQALPPLNALRVFEVAARTGSYADAAAELGITHGAVSRHVAVLERWLGQRLFAKDGRRMVATPMAKVFAAEVAHSFERVARAAAACGRPDTRRLLRVSAPTTFAMRWLIPRLDRFHARYPDMEVVVTTVSTVQEDLRGGVDIAIRRANHRAHAWPEHDIVPVLDDGDTLIMSPGLFARSPVLTLADVANHPWLASETRAGDWADWLAVAGLPPRPDHSRRVFDHFFVTQRAVEDGLGLGIGPLPLLSIDVAAGRLITPLPDIRVSRPGYVAVVPRHLGGSAGAGAFVEWLAGEGQSPHQA